MVIMVSFVRIVSVVQLVSSRCQGRSLNSSNCTAQSLGTNDIGALITIELRGIFYGNYNIVPKDNYSDPVLKQSRP